MIHISFYVPVKDAERVKNAMFHAGAGKIGNYDSCSFEMKGVGQFRPLSGSNPAIGSQDMLESVDELKVEMVCDEAIIQEVISALKKSHPYETPAYYAIKTLNY
ncbi:MAG: NGG1p interacting factor NIF3 [Bdellovibrionota bacterium]